MEHEIRRPKVLVFVNWYLPGFKGGGAMRSAVGVVNALRGEFDFSIVTSDTDASETTPYPGIGSDAWNTLPDGTRIFYCSGSGRTKASLGRVMREVSPDLVYISGLFSYPFTALPLRLARELEPPVRVLLAPRGMLNPGALGAKAFKKRAFITAAKISGLFKGITWHASSQQEADEIRAAIGESASVELAMDLALPTLKSFVTREKRPGEVRLFFLSRIVRNKNLLEAIRFVKRVGSSCKVHLDIFGPAEDVTYWQQCHLEMQQLPDHVSIEYHGAVEPERIAYMLARHHFLLLPTHFENFGHVILESFAASCPVIISDRTPWRDLPQRHLGWDIPLSDPAEFVRAIETAASMDAEKFRQWSQAAYSFGEGHLTDRSALEAHRTMFHSLTRQARIG